jgi:hypothetical protein
VAGYSLSKVNAVVGKLGAPIGMASYKPYQSTGEDFLHNYLGMIGIPIDLHPEFPSDAKTVLLTESAKFDPAIVSKIKTHLEKGGNVVITSGLLRALQGKGIEQIVESAGHRQRSQGHGLLGRIRGGRRRQPGRHLGVLDPGDRLPDQRRMAARARHGQWPRRAAHDHGSLLEGQSSTCSPFRRIPTISIRCPSRC